jgi:hypothetical protein
VGLRRPVGGDDLPGHPGGLVADDPSDQACGVLGRAGSPARIAFSYPRPRGLVGVAGVVRARVDAVDGDSTSGEVRRQRRGQLTQGSLGGDVGQLIGHHSVVLPRGEQHHPAASTAVELGCEVADQQQRRAGVHGVGEVELAGGEVLEGLPHAAGVVGEDDVEPTERLARNVDKVGRRTRVSEVSTDVNQLSA